MEDGIKTLANCTDEEFLSQSYKVAEAVQEWLSATDVIGMVRKIAAAQKEAEGADAEGKEAASGRAFKAFMEIYRKCAKEHPRETLAVTRLCCFTEPDDDSRRITYYLGGFAQMIGNRDVVDFFSSLASMARMLGATG